MRPHPVRLLELMIGFAVEYELGRTLQVQFTNRLSNLEGVNCFEAYNQELL
jgi:hypothetical protein